MNDQEPHSAAVEGVAIIGMAGRFPGARNVAEFWRNQLEGIESISQFRVEDLEIANKAEVESNPQYIRARSVLDDVDLFDAEFFGINPREAALIDPQQRLFLECCWQALEDAGYVPDSYPGQIGVYAGSSIWSYFLTRLCTSPGFIQEFTSGYQVSNYLEMMGNSLDFLSTRVSYKLNLRGPSFTLQSACSTSLVAVTQACQSLLTYQSDMALAGGVSITFPQKRGYQYQDGGMVSADGHCRAFDADAQGTVFGSGVGVVLLKRVEDAIKDGDQVYAVIRGFAVNNDGATKVGYTAPSVEGQARVIAMAQEAAGVEPDSIGYIEAHGTGTPLGDPIELEGLTQAFGARTRKRQFCTIGTAKTNVGHLDIAAGVTGLINATHIVRHGEFPPTLHFRKPNTKFDLERSPFLVRAERTKWSNGKAPRRAGVSAFGVGGTNVHVVIEQAPARKSSPSERSDHLIVLSARSETALDQATANLVAHLKAAPDLDFSDVAWTLQAGRRAFACRRTVTARDAADAIAALSEGSRERVRTRLAQSENPAVCFLFPGQGSQHPDMAREVYYSEPVFRDAVDRCAEILRPHLGADLRELLYPPKGITDEARRRVTQTVVAQPAIFAIEYALAQLWMSWGVKPQAMVGHSIGEFVAACIAGVFSLEDALALIAARGRMMQDAPSGGMLSVRLPEAEVTRRLREPLSLAAVNSPALCVVAGPSEALDHFEQDLNREGVASRRLVTSHAFHSAMMDPFIDSLKAIVSKLKLSAPTIPYLSGVTGTWLTEHEATDPFYWARHAREPVLFSAAIKELRKDPNAVLLEVGPGNVLATLARQHSEFPVDQIIVSSLSDGFSGDGDFRQLMNALGSLWLAGVQPDWSALYSNESRQRVSLPTYPFQRKRYDLEIPAESQSTAVAAAKPAGSTRTDVTSPFTHTTAAVESMTKALSFAEPTATPSNRNARIRASLVEIFEDLSGQDLAAVDGATTFLEMGFDSLFLTQVSQALQERFGIKITFRQLLGDESSLDALNQYILDKVPQENFAEEAPAQKTDLTALVAVAAESAGAAPIAGSEPVATSEAPVERLMREQLQAMNQLFANQLAALRGSSPTGAVAAPTARAAIAVAAPQEPGVDAKTSPAVEKHKPFGPYRPPQTSVSAELIETQRKNLAIFVDRYAARTAKSKLMTQQNRSILADPRVVSGFRTEWKEIVYPIITDRSQGARLWDIDGNEYIDLVNGFGPIMLGHRPDFVQKAIEQQLQAGFETGPQTPLAGEVAKLFCEMTGNERMSFCNTGSEAVLAALRVSRTVTGRNKVVMFTGDYHGMFDEVLVKGFKDKAGRQQAAPIAPGIPRESVSNMIVLDYGTPQSLEWIRQNAKDLAAVLVEPVQSRHPALQPVEFLKELRKITQDAGAALIFDEVVTGFRVHPGGCQALFGIRADLATYGKVVAGGLPIGIVAGSAQFMDALDGGMWQYGDDSFPEVGVTFFAGTFVRHPLAVAAAKAVLQHLKERGPSLQEKLSARTAALVRTLNQFCQQRNIPTRLESFGSFFYFGFPNEERFAGLFYYYMREKGIHIREGFPCFLTTAHSEADIEKIVQAFKDSAIEMRQAGFFAAVASDAREPVAVGQGIVAQASGPAQAPMTEPQREVFLAAMLGDDVSCAFNESFSLHLHGSLQVEALSDAMNALLARHEALRATVDPDGATLHFKPELRLEIPLRDLSLLTPAAREAELKRLLAEDAQTAFDLTNGPLVRTQLVRVAPDHHVLIFTSHHIVCDGWSTNVILDEFARIYSGTVLGRTADLPPVIRFSDYAQSHAGTETSSADARTEAYWLSQFKDIPPPLELPLDRPRASVKSYAGATYRGHIDAESYRKIRQLGAKKGCTLFVTLLAGFQALLHRLSDQDDVVVGIPTAGQSSLDGGSLVGHCVNFLPIRTRLRQGQTFADLLAAVKTTLLDAYEHQSYTYGTLVRNLAIPRDPSRLPLMEVQFNLERIGASADFGGLKANVDPNPKGAVNFDIFFNIVESDEGLTIDCDYNTDLFEAATIGRWLESFRLLLLGAVSDPQGAVNALPLAAPAIALTSPSTDPDRELLARWNDTSTDYPRDKSIVKLFEEQVERTPDAVALVFGAQKLTYSELNGRANRLARYLRQSKIGAEDVVACCLERSVELIVAVLGLLKAGAAYAPLDPAAPKERLEYMLSDTRARLILTQRKLIDLGLSVLTIPMVALDDPDFPAWSDAPENLDSVPKPEHLAYVMYTSGSTGRPKGVMIEHRSVVRLVKDTNYCAFGPTEVFLQLAPITFDASTLEIWGALLNGGRLIVMPPEPPSLEDLGRVIRDHGVTTLWLTAGLFHVMVEQRLEDLQPLRQLLAGGDVLSPWHVRQVIEKFPNLRMINGYGPTENTTFTCCHTFAPQEAVPDPVPIGRPISNTRAYILDSALQAVPIGQAGELCIAGDGLARGYLNSPDLTGMKFVSYVRPGGGVERIYRTGDQARFLPDGTIQFLGRTDNQVKLRGYRIELDEIEAVLRRHPGVRQACVVAEREGASVKRLLAYCVPAEKVSLSEAALHEHLRSALPQYMLPETIITLDALPLTSNGKVDRAKLPSPIQARGGRPREYVAPNTLQEKQLAEIVGDVLRIERVGVTDNLFELGADSLQVFQITSRAVKGGLAITPRMVLKDRTIRRVISELGTAKSPDAGPTSVIKPVARQKYRATLEGS